MRTVRDFLVQQIIKDLRYFVCLFSYLRRFVRAFASVAATLTALLRKDNVFHLPSDCSHAFSHLKAVLTSSPVLRHYNPDAPVEIDTNASGFGIGAVLAQRCDNNTMEHAVANARHSLSKVEQKYTNDKERMQGDCFGCGEILTLPLLQSF